MIEVLLQPEVKATFTMFVLTVLFTSAFYWPAVRFPQKNKILNFYWVGFWLFLSFLTAISGSKATLGMTGSGADNFSNALLIGLTLSFVLFVVFAWARLALMTVTHVVKKHVT